MCYSTRVTFGSACHTWRPSWLYLVWTDLLVAADLDVWNIIWYIMYIGVRIVCSFMLYNIPSLKYLTRCYLIYGYFSKNLINYIFYNNTKKNVTFMQKNESEYCLNFLIYKKKKIQSKANNYYLILVKAFFWKTVL